MKRIFKEALKVLAGFVIWFAVFCLFALLDDWCGHWLTNQEVTKILMQVLINASGYMALTLMDAKLVSVVAYNIIMLAFIGIFSSVGLSQYYAIIMWIGFIPFVLEKTGKG